MADKKLMELISKNEDLIQKHKELGKKHIELARKHEDLHNEISRYAEDMDDEDSEDVEKNEEETPKTETDMPNPDEKKKEKNEIEVEKLEWNWNDWMTKDPQGLMKLAAEGSEIYLKLQSEVENGFRKVGLDGERGYQVREMMKKGEI